MIKKTEVGVVDANVLQYLLLQIKTIIKTWLWCKTNGVECNKWYGVYAVDSEIIVAQTGCTDQAEKYAQIMSESINKQYQEIDAIKWAMPRD